MRLVHDTNVMGVMKMGNTMPIAGLEPTYPAFWASVPPCRLPDVTMISMPTCLCRSFPQRSPRLPHIYQSESLSLWSNISEPTYSYSQCKRNCITENKGQSAFCICNIYIYIYVLFANWHLKLHSVCIEQWERSRYDGNLLTDPKGRCGICCQFEWR